MIPAITHNNVTPQTDPSQKVAASTPNIVHTPFGDMFTDQLSYTKYGNPELYEASLRAQAASNGSAAAGPSVATAPATSPAHSAPAAPAATPVVAPAAGQTTTPAVTSTPKTTATPADTSSDTGISALVDAMMDGSFQASYVTNPSSLVEATPLGSFSLPSQPYATDQAAQQLAQLLGGTVVQKPNVPVPNGWQTPQADFIQLPTGQVVNAGDLESYAKCSYLGAQQLTADLTQEINQGGAISSFNDGVQSLMNGASSSMPAMPSFAIGDPGAAIAGMTYPDGTVAADGAVINPAYHTQGV